MQLSKKDVMSMLKAFMKRTVAYLTEKGKEDRVPSFKKGATEMVKLIMGRFDEMQIFTGSSMDVEASMCFAYTEDGETDPTFLFFNDAYIQEKF
tara:strand:+ start:402 stop:683 length:282 start_codon:yes stop_codon:yes gene_type:complete